MLTTPQEFYVKDGLYDEVHLTQEDKKLLYEIIYSTATIDCHCIECNRETVFSPEENRPYFAPRPNMSTYTTNYNHWKVNIVTANILVSKIFSCSRNNEHKLIFHLLINQGKFQKIGQYPSIKDINIAEIKQFKSILKNEFFTEYSTAIGLYSHGVGIGSFVYLRRILENFIIKPAHSKAKKETTWEEDKFQKMRMNERISVLKKFLPNYLVENKQLYSVVSKGIHELTEQECREFFPVVSSVLNYILTELKERERTEKQKSELKKKLSEIGGKIK